MPDSRNFIEKYGVNIGGAIYTLACLSEISTFLGMNIFSAVCMGTSIVIDLTRGHKNKWLMAGASFGLIGTVAGAADEICGGKWKSLAGAALATGGLSLIIASEYLTNRYANSSCRILRHTLGRPRLLGGAMLILSGGLMAYDKFSEALYPEATYYSLLAAGDIPVSLSKPKPRPGAMPGPSR